VLELLQQLVTCEESRWCYQNLPLRRNHPEAATQDGLQSLSDLTKNGFRIDSAVFCASHLRLSTLERGEGQVIRQTLTR
jgi:hypothetical protein